MPNPRRLAALLAVAVAAAAGAPACGGGGSDCERAYELVKKCSERAPAGGDPGKAPFIERCEKTLAEVTAEERAATMACVKSASCEELAACQQAQQQRRRVGDVADAVAAGRWKDAFEDCTRDEADHADAAYRAACEGAFANAGKLAADPDDLASAMFRCRSAGKLAQVAPAFVKACQALAAAQLPAAQSTALAAREAGRNDFKVCSDLEELAKIAGDDAPAAARKTCDELVASESARKAADDARGHAKDKKPAMPFRCGAAAAELAKLDTDWAKRTLEALHRACYVELGAVILQEHAKDAKYACPSPIKALIDAAGKYDLAAKFPELAAALKKLPPKCKRT